MNRNSATSNTSKSSRRSTRSAHSTKSIRSIDVHDTHNTNDTHDTRDTGNDAIIKNTESTYLFGLIANQQKLRNVGDTDTQKNNANNANNANNNEQDSYKNPDDINIALPEPVNSPNYNNTYQEYTPYIQPEHTAYETENKPETTHEKNTKTIEKLQLLKELAELKSNGIRLSQNYTINSDIELMKFERDLHKNIINKRKNIKLMSGFLLWCVRGMEWVNNSYDPFGFQLDGWSEHFQSEIGDYYAVLSELHDKYCTKESTWPPELKLAGLVGWSGFQYVLANKIFSCSIDEEIAKNPELLRKIKEEAAKKQKDKTNANNDKLNAFINTEHDIALTHAKNVEMLQRENNQVKPMQHTTEQHAAVPEYVPKASNAPNENLNNFMNNVKSQATLNAPIISQSVYDNIQKRQAPKETNNSATDSTQQTSTITERKRKKGVIKLTTDR